MFAHFQLGRHEPEIELSYHIRHLAGLCKELFYSFRTW